MNLNALRTFVVIVDQGSLIRAAEHLNVTQSTITARLQKLEEELGQQLLIRQKAGVTLTPSGVRLLRYARVMNGLWNQMYAETRLPKGLDSVCTFGCLSALWSGPGQAFFSAARQARPNMALSVHQGSVEELEQWLTSGLVDVILTTTARTGDGRAIYPLPPEQLLLISDRPDTPIRHSGSYIFVDYGAQYRQLHAETYHDAGVARISFDQPDWALNHLLEVGGSAYLPYRLVAPFLISGRLHHLREAPVYEQSLVLASNTQARSGWDWFDAVLADLCQTGSFVSANVRASH